MATQTQTTPIMPEAQKRDVRGLDSSALMDFQIRLQVECGMTQGEAADYVAQAFGGQEDLCWHCSQTLDADECGTAEIEAHWIDADGRVSDETRLVCRDCYDAGDHDSGPGYRAAEPRWEDWEPIDGESAYCSSRVAEHESLEYWVQVGEIGNRRAKAIWISDGEPDWDAQPEPDRIEWVEG